MMKKYAFVLFAIVISLCISHPALAATQASFTLQPSSTQVIQYEEIEVPIVITTTTSVAAFDAHIHYDPQNISILNVYIKSTGDDSEFYQLTQGEKAEGSEGFYRIIYVDNDGGLTGLAPGDSIILKIRACGRVGNDSEIKIDVTMAGDADAKAISTSGPSINVNINRNENSESGNISATDQPFGSIESSADLLGTTNDSLITDIIKHTDGYVSDDREQSTDVKKAQANSDVLLVAAVIVVICTLVFLAFFYWRRKRKNRPQ